MRELEIPRKVLSNESVILTSISRTNYYDTLILLVPTYTNVRKKPMSIHFDNCDNAGHFNPRKKEKRCQSATKVV